MPVEGVSISNTIRDEVAKAAVVTYDPRYADTWVSANTQYAPHVAMRAFAICPICGLQVATQYMVTRELLRQGLGDALEFRLDLRQHFRDVIHTDKQWRAAYFLDKNMLMNGGGVQPPGPDASRLPDPDQVTKMLGSGHSPDELPKLLGLRPDQTAALTKGKKSGE